MIQHYWLSYGHGSATYDTCITEHPFEFIKELNKRQEHNPILPPGWLWQSVQYELLNWRSITPEDFNLWEEINK